MSVATVQRLACDAGKDICHERAPGLGDIGVKVVEADRHMLDPAPERP